MKTDFSSNFSTWAPSQPDKSSLVQDGQSGINVLQVNTLASFIQALGYLKHKYRGTQQILYRGQTRLSYDEIKSKMHKQFSLLPAGFRGLTRIDAVQHRKRHIATIVETIRNANSMFTDSKVFPDRVIEGLLQQYGIPTSWIDVVDNIWVALWFACYYSDNTIEVSANSFGKTAETRTFFHMVRREPRREKEENRFAYVLLLSGVDDDKTELLDLRSAIPSQFLRPHVQHGLLVRTKFIDNPDMSLLIKGIIRIKLEDALEWLGHGRILTTEYMMPPPNYDSGFKQLLTSESKMKATPVCFPIYC